jgi:excisionase family DNA binding protein
MATAPIFEVPAPALAHSPEKAAKRISTSTRQVYLLIATGELRSFKSGKRRLIPDSELVRYVERKLQEADSARSVAPATVVPTPAVEKRGRGRPRKKPISARAVASMATAS